MCLLTYLKLLQENVDYAHFLLMCVLSYCVWDRHGSRNIAMTFYDYHCVKFTVSNRVWSWLMMQ